MKVLTVIGTRPEAIKLAPVVRALAAEPGVTTRVVASAQHRQLLDQVLELFEVVPDHDLDVMTAGQSPSRVAAAVFSRLEEVLERERPLWVVVQGDTTTTMAAAVCAFYGGARVAHVEAGLRTGDLANPFPEEANRAVVSRVASLHLAATEGARHNLLAEGIDPSVIRVTGNTVVDALAWIRDRHPEPPLPPPPAGTRRLVLTCHRRESFGGGLENVCTAVRALVDELGDALQVVVPVHPNPRVEAVFAERLGALPQVALLPPLSYGAFVALASSAWLLLSDSGGVQEEAPSLGVPVLVLRRKSERPEALAAGTARLVGTDPATITAAVLELWRDDAVYRRMIATRNPFGDGRAAARVVAALAGRPGEPFTPPAPADDVTA